jgi:hypothetical protein
MLAKLEPLHAMLERGPQTLKETSFHQAYGNDLNEAKRWCSRYKMSANIRDLNQAWDLYYHVFRRISRQLPQLTQLELQYVSPKLLMCRDLELAVPVSHTNFTIFFAIAARISKGELPALLKKIVKTRGHIIHDLTSFSDISSSGILHTIWNHQQNSNGRALAPSHHFQTATEKA